MIGNHHFRELFRRHPSNPILTAPNWPYPANSVFNAGATRLQNGETLLLARVEDRRGISHLTAARSADGITDWRIDPTADHAADAGNCPEEIWGIEDPRIVWLEDVQRFAVTYTAYSRLGPLVALALTEDFKTFERRGPIMPPEDKDAAFFPRKFDGRWALIHRPVPNVPGAKAHMWLSFSPDLKHWGDHMVLLEARDGAYWDAGQDRSLATADRDAGGLADHVPRRAAHAGRRTVPARPGAARPGGSASGAPAR